MNLLAADIVERFYTFLWPMLRISALMVTAPIFSLTAFNLRLRILMALVMAWLIYPLHTWPVIDPSTASGLVEVFNQIMIGAVMGLILQVVVAAMVVGGQSIAAAMGLSMATMVDPTMGSVPVVSAFFNILGTLVFLSIGGHLIVFGLLLESFTLFPIGKSLMTPDLLGKMTAWGAMMFVAGLLISLPVVITLLFVRVSLLKTTTPSANNPESGRIKSGVTGVDMSK